MRKPIFTVATGVLTAVAVLAVRAKSAALPAPASAIPPATQPRLVILDAKWGTANQSEDVTKIVQEHVESDHLQMHVDPALFPSIVPRQRKQLTITYSLDGQQKTVQFKGQTDASIGPPAVAGSSAPAGPGASPTTAPASLIIVKATYGNAARHKDVTEELRAVVQGDSLTVPVGDAAFGSPAVGLTEKNLHVTYQDAQGVHTVAVRAGEKLQIGPTEVPMLAGNGRLTNLTQRLAELQAKFPNQLIVLDARFGTGNRWNNVTDQLQKMVKGHGLAVYVGHETFGDPAPGSAFQVLEIRYFDGKSLQFERCAEGKKYAFGQGIAELASGPGDGVNESEAPEKPAKGHKAGASAGTPSQFSGEQSASSGGRPAALEELRKTYGDGLIFISAKWAYGPDGTDLRETFQNAIVNDHFSTPATNEAMGNPDPYHNGTRTLHVSYWDGSTVQRDMIKQGGTFEATGARPEVLKSLPALPTVAVESQPLSASLASAKGQLAFALASGPKGMKVSADGEISWTPSSADIGRQRAVISVKKVGDESFLRWEFDVAPAVVAAEAHGDPTAIASLVRLPIADSNHGYSTELRSYHALLRDGQNLRVLDSDGIKVLQQVQFAKSYVRIGERKDYFVGIRVEPLIMDIIDKSTGQPTKSIPLSYEKFKDFALMPGKARTFVAVQAVQTCPRDRVVIVNETTGDVTTPPDLSGSYLAFDRSGKHLWVGIRDLYKTGTELHFNPDWSIIEMPTYGNIDIFLRFDVTDSELGLRDRIEDAGGNGTGIRVSPDGRHATYMSFTGYPLQSKDLPAWDGLDFSKRPVEFPIKDKADTTHINYHPFLPLAVVPAKGHNDGFHPGAYIFNANTGEPDDTHFHLSPLTLAGARVHDACFSPDGLNLLLVCQRANESFLYRCPLTLTPEEKAATRSGLAAVPAE